MDTWRTSIYIGEIRHQVEAASTAATQFNSALRLKDVGTMFAASQALLTSAALISKLLWPAPARWMSAERKKTAVDRGAHLRTELQVSDDSPLRTRTVRNAFEHFDEVLDEWLDQHAGYVADRIVTDAPNGPISIAEKPARYLRMINNRALTVSVMDEAADLQELMAAMDRLSEAADTWLRTKGAATPPPGLNA